MSQILQVSEGQFILRPLARNMLRASVLSVDYQVQFYSDEQPYIKIGAKEFYKPATELLEKLQELDLEKPITEELIILLNKLYVWLQPQNKQKALDSLETILNEVKRQTLCGSYGEHKSDFDSFWFEWKKKYPIPQQFELIGKSIVNDTNRSEAADYIAAHEKAAEGVKSIDQAIDSLAVSIPSDVETILDVGSGPGYVDGKLPADYSILAMDIDTEILRQNPRITCVGDIMNIPLADDSMDLVMACDTLEHLPDDVLMKGISEMERVSRKYIYLQVPFQEDPTVGFAHCPSCGNVWHVNHHKRSFDEDGLKSLLSDDWKPVLINYTGDVYYRRSGLMAYNLAATLKRQIYCAEKQICPRCGEQSKPLGAENLSLLQQIAHYDTNVPFPVYSEIGILFARQGVETHLPEVHRPKGFLKRSGNVISLQNESSPQLIYSGTELFSSLYLYGCHIEEDMKSCILIRDPETDIAWVAFAFSPAYRKEPEFEITGSLSEAGEVHVSLLDGAGDEHYVRTWNWDETERHFSLSLSGRKSFRPYYIKLYFKAEKMRTNGSIISGEGGKTVREYLHQETAFISFRNQQTEYRLYVPQGEKLLLSHSPQEWLSRTKEVHRRTIQAVSRFVQNLKEQYPNLEKSDNRRLIAASIMPEPQGIGSAEEPDNKWLIAASSMPEFVKGFEARDLQLIDMRGTIEDSMLAEAELQIYRIGEVKSIKRRIRERTYRHLKKRKDQMHHWFHRHEKMYESLIKLGLKDHYMKIKRRIKP